MIITVLFYELLIVVAAMMIYFFYRLFMEDRTEEKTEEALCGKSLFVPFDDLDQLHRAEYIYNKATFVTLAHDGDLRLLIYQLGKEYRYSYAVVTLTLEDNEVKTVRTLKDDEIVQYLPDVSL